jgi:hypothetical protein
MEEFKWRPGAVNRGVDPNTAHKEFERLRKEHGELTPSIVVDAARQSESALHPIFEWNDSKAAEEYRLGQARNVLRAIVKHYPEIDETAPVYVHVRSPNPRYEKTELVVNDASAFACAVDELTEKLSGAEKALRQLQNIASGAERTAVNSAASSIRSAREVIEGLPS